MNPFLSISVRKQDHHKTLKKFVKLYSLTTILRSETELDVKGGQAKTGCFTRELYLVISKLSLFPGPSSFQSLPPTPVLSDQDAKLLRKTAVHPARPSRAVARGSSLLSKVISSS